MRSLFVTGAPGGGELRPLVTTHRLCGNDRGHRGIAAISFVFKQMINKGYISCNLDEVTVCFNDSYRKLFISDNKRIQVNSGKGAFSRFNKCTNDPRHLFSSRRIPAD